MSKTKEQTTVVDEDAHTQKFLGAVAIPGFIVTSVVAAVQAAIIAMYVWTAYTIRTIALTEFGMVIHEFDPWFNFRATQYLSKHGWHSFFHWFDYMSWYPLGRPVGTTIYPGLQITSVAIHKVLKYMGKKYRMTINDICCTVPCWGGVAATILLAAITHEVSGSRNAAVIAAMFFAIMPAHIMRSVGGGYDNESIAMTAMLLTFYCWIRSLRTSSSWPIGILTGLAYGYMVAAWGGYIFVVNMIGIHAGFLVLVDWASNRWSARLHKAYSLFFVIGTYIATCVPPVGYAPFKSLEQIAPLLVFIFMQTLYFAEVARKAAKADVLSKKTFLIRFRYILMTVGGITAVALMLAPTGFFGPLSSRVRGLFLKHTRTGNPLVDSVAEHQPASADAYWHYMHIACYGWQVGVFVLPFVSRRIRASTFLWLYAIIAYYFSMKMARLVLLAGPVSAAMTGVCLGVTVDWILAQFWWSEADDQEAKLLSEGKNPKTGQPNPKKGIDSIFLTLQAQYKSQRMARLAIAVAIIGVLYTKGPEQWKIFQDHSDQMAHSFSNPQLMFKTRLNNGQTVIIDDYREAYHWLRDKTPKDSRVMAWWDYGYQITGIGNRTSIADGNTWNHEHIATLGKCLTSPVKEAHSLIRHLADYVLIWSGGGGDDLAKSPHMARIGNSVYRDICPNDPLCQHFGFYGQNHEQPTPSMKKSLLYNMHAHNTKPGINLDPKLFKEAYSSRYGLVRIFKVQNIDEESKKWIADPANKICDAPGSWYCVGQYPPAKPIQKLLKKKRDFGQLEDFNKKKGAAKKKSDEEYHRQYMKGH